MVRSVLRSAALGAALSLVLAAPSQVRAQPATDPAAAPKPQVVIAEGEAFKPQDSKGWKLTPQDLSYASHTYGGMWVTHGALLGAPAASNGSVATQTVQIPAAG